MIALNGLVAFVKKQKGRSDTDYEQRITDEVWAYLVSPKAQEQWAKVNTITSKVKNFVKAISDFFKDKLGFKGNTNIQNATLEELILSGANSVLKGEYLDAKNIAELERKEQKDTTQFAISTENNNLNDFVKKQKDKGISDAMIKEVLLLADNLEADIDAALQKANEKEGGTEKRDKIIFEKEMKKKKKRKILKTFFHAILAIILFLVITNPNMKNFKEYLGENNDKEAKRNQNWLIFSIYENEGDKFFAICMNFSKL